MKRSWEETRELAVKSFRGELPRAETEQDIIEAFQARPSAVLDALEQVKHAFANGQARSGWAVWRKRVQRDNLPAVIVDVADDREKRVASTERWLRHSGYHFDRESEVLEELFGDLGSLREWQQDELLRQRMASLWRSVRPLGEQVERETAEASRRYIEWRKQMDAKKKRAPIVSP